MLNALRYTKATTKGYWIVGTILIWLLLPASLIDLLIDPTWVAPNWQCDSLGIPIGETIFALVPWAVIAGLVSALLAIPTARNRQRGVDILDPWLGKKPWNWIFSLLALFIIALILWDFATHIWQALIPQTFSDDCGGSADLVVVTRRGPLIQISPLIEIGIGVWLLHLRALVLSPRTK
jgi:hypothetical protein